MDSVAEGEGGKIWENAIETCIISCMKRVSRPGSMHDTGCLGLVHWDDPEGGYVLTEKLRNRELRETDNVAGWRDPELKMTCFWLWLSLGPGGEGADQWGRTFPIR